jgi:transcriptional regulator with XRE-family HTH domain
MSERERIELLMKCYDLSPSQFADKTGIQRASVSHIISGRNKPSLEVMLKIYDAFPGIDMKWLMTGVGEVPVRRADAEPAVNFSNESLFPEQTIARQADNTLFAANVEQVPPVAEESKPRRAVAPPPVRERGVSEPRPKRQQANRLAQMAALQPDKKIKEIRIYYSDGTYETLVPEKS